MKDLSLNQPQGDEDGDTSAQAANGTNAATEADASGEDKGLYCSGVGIVEDFMHCKIGVIMV